MKVALLVEGSVSVPVSGRSADPLTEVWNLLASTVAGKRPFDLVVGISKDQLVQMDPAVRTLSTMREPLDEFLARVISTHGIDAAVVAWDLQPKWNSQATVCRWNETLALYTGLAHSSCLLKHGSLALTPG